MNPKINIYEINDNENQYYIAGNNILSVIDYFLNEYLDEFQCLEVDKNGFDINRLSDNELSDTVYDEEMNADVSFNIIIEELKNDNIPLPQVISSNE